MPLLRNPIAAPCNCLALRQAARRVTQFYDQALAPGGLRTTQYSVLAVLRRLQPVTQGALADALVMDRATLGHNLRPLQLAGWVEIAPGADRRQRVLRLTDAGRARLHACVPLWQAAQTAFEASFGAEQAAAMRDILAMVAAQPLGDGTAAAGEIA